MVNKFKKIFAVKVDFRGSETRFVKATSRKEAKKLAPDSWIGICGTTFDEIINVPKAESVTKRTYRHLMGIF